MTRRLLILGAGGHAREVLDIVEARNVAAVQSGGVAEWEVLGMAADGHADREAMERRGVAFLGPITEVDDIEAHYVVAIGSPAARREVEVRMTAAGRAAAVLVHPTAVIGGDVELGPGTVLAAGSHVTTNVRLGRHVHVNIGCVVSHDARIGDHVTLSPGCLVNGNVTIEPEAFLGTGAVVIPGRSIGHGAIVGAGAVVVDDVPSGVTARGVPARW